MAVDSSGDITSSWTANPRRIIARLDIKGPNVIKGVQMDGLKVVGTPDSLALRYSQHGADELLILDSVATLYGRSMDLPLVQSAVSEVFIPVTLGGGVTCIDDALRMLSAGADKVAVNSGAVRDPSLITQLSQILGRQSVISSIEAKRVPRGGWELFVDNGREPTGHDVLQWVESVDSLGAGELLVTSVDQDGTQSGFDLELLAAIRSVARMPIIASGGCGSVSDIIRVFELGIDAVAVGTILHLNVVDIRMIRQDLRSAGFHMRALE